MVLIQRLVASRCLREVSRFAEAGHGALVSGRGRGREEAGDGAKTIRRSDERRVLALGRLALSL